MPTQPPEAIASDTQHDSIDRLATRPALVASVGSAFPQRAYTQDEVGALLGLTNRVVRRLLSAPHIRTRHLYLPPANADGRIPPETTADLNRRFRDGALELGGQAIEAALGAASLTAGDVDYLMCITTTGFMVPGLSSLLSRELGFRSDLHRADLVGMGCNAGLNGLNPVVQWVTNHPDRIALLVCCEINSAIYVVDDTPGTGIVNSLFGDGAAAAVVTTRSTSAGEQSPRPHIIDFESFCMPDQWPAMRFDWNSDQSKWSFFLDRDIPYVIGFNVYQPVDRLLARHGLDRSAIRHWVMHTGGGAVIDSIKLGLGLGEYDVRHTRSVLRDYGNISSGSYLVSLERLLAEGTVAEGDFGMMITMGPGAQIETALFRF